MEGASSAASASVRLPDLAAPLARLASSRRRLSSKILKVRSSGDGVNQRCGSRRCAPAPLVSRRVVGAASLRPRTSAHNVLLGRLGLGKVGVGWVDAVVLALVQRFEARVGDVDLKIVVKGLLKQGSSG